MNGAVGSPYYFCKPLSCLHNLPEVLNRFFQAFAQLDGGFPIENGFGLVNDGLALLRVVLCGGLVDDFRLCAGQLNHQLRQLFDGKLVGIPQVDGAGDGIIGIHHSNETVDKVVAIAEAAGLETVAIDGDVFAFEGLHDEVGNHAPVIGVHVRPIGIENAHHLDFDFVLSVSIPITGSQKASQIPLIRVILPASPVDIPSTYAKNC